MCAICKFYLSMSAYFPSHIFLVYAFRCHTSVVPCTSLVFNSFLCSSRYWHPRLSPPQHTSIEATCGTWRSQRYQSVSLSQIKGFHTSAAARAESLRASLGQKSNAKVGHIIAAVHFIRSCFMLFHVNLLAACMP